MLLFAATDWFNTWLTPLWLLGLGGLLGLVLLLAGWALVAVVSRRAAAEVPARVQEGPLLPVFWTVVALAVFGVVGGFLVRDTGDLLRSIPRVFATGRQVIALQIGGSAADAEDTVAELPLRVRPHEIRTIEVVSDQPLIVTSPVEELGEPLLKWPVESENVYLWDRGLINTNPFEREGMDRLLLANQSEQPADVQVVVSTSPLHPQTSTVPITGVAIFVVFVLYFLMQWLMPKTAAIALATSKSEMAQPLFLILIGLGFFLIGLFMYIPYHTFGEDIKVLKDSGLTLIMVFAIIHAVWAASTSVADEIEGKTALTVLSKPIGRRQFILGKFFGIGWSTAVIFVLLGVWLLIIVAYKPIYDARESANTDPTWQECHLEMVRTVPGLFLAYLETLVFAALGVAISTRLPMLANILICFTIYAFGHLTPLLVQGAEGQFVNVRFVARFIATLLPVLDHFNIQAAVAAGVGVSYQYLMWATVYCALYCTIAMLLALVLFEDRDLA